MAVSGTIEWTPDFQDLDLGHRRAYQDVTGTLELVSFIFEFWDCCLSSQSRHLNKHCLQRCYWEFEDPSLCQTLSANSGDTPSKMNYGTCHFPKYLILFHLCTSRIVFSTSECLPLILHLSKLPFPQYPTHVLSST